MSVAERTFCQHYAVFANGAQADRIAFPEIEAHREHAYALLTKPHIQEEINRLRGDLGELHFDLANQVLAQYKAMASADVTAMFDADGNLLDPERWPDECKLLVNGFEIEEQMRGEGDDAMLVRVKKVKLETRKGVLDSISKTIGTFTERLQHLGKDGRPADPMAIVPPTIVYSVPGMVPVQPPSAEAQKAAAALPAAKPKGKKNGNGNGG